MKMRYALITVVALVLSGCGIYGGTETNAEAEGAHGVDEHVYGGERQASSIPGSENDGADNRSAAGAGESESNDGRGN